MQISSHFMSKNECEKCKKTKTKNPPQKKPFFNSYKYYSQYWSICTHRFALLLRNVITLSVNESDQQQLKQHENNICAALLFTRLIRK